MQLVVSLGLVLTGLAIALVMDATGEMRAFGWLLAGIGVLGLLARWWLKRQYAAPRRG